MSAGPVLSSLSHEQKDALIAALMTQVASGAGLAVYDSNSNQVIGNLSYANLQGNISDHGDRDEVYFTSTVSNGTLNYGNTIDNNVICNSVTNVKCLYFDAGS